MLGDGGRVGAAIVGHRHAGLARCAEVGPIIAGTEQLDQLQARTGLEQRAVNGGIDIADEILGIFHLRAELGGPGRGKDKVETGRGHFAGHVVGVIGM